MILNALLVSIYWFSFPYVGLHILSILEKRWKSPKISTDPIIRLFLGLCLGFATFLPLAVLGYIFSASIEPISIIWALLVIAFATRYRNSRELSDLARALFGYRWFWLLAGVLAADYALSLYVGGYFSGDAWGHMARINDILQNGFTIFDPYFPNLIDLRANVSLTHAFYATGASLTGNDAVTIWLLSLAFFRFAMSLTVYVVMKLITRSKFVSVITTVVAAFAFSYDWRFTQYPNKLARLWLIFISLGSIEILRNPKNKIARTILISGALLSALTHPVYSAGIAGFILITIFVHWLLSGRKFSQAYIWLLACVPILVSSTIAGALLPARSSFISGRPGELSSFLGMTIMNPRYIYSTTTFLISVGFLIYIFRTSKSTALRSAALAAVVTFPLITFTPLFDLAREYLSPRIIFRYRSGTNFLRYNLTNTAAIILISYLIITKILKWRKPVVIWIMILITTTLAFTYRNSVMRFALSQTKRTDAGIHRVNQIKRAINGVKTSKDQLLVSSLDSSYVLGSSGNISVVAIPNGHFPRSYNRQIREECLRQLLSDDNMERHIAIATIKPNYYLLDSKLQYLSDVPELKLISSDINNGGLKFYKIDTNFLRTDGEQSKECQDIVNGNA